MSRRWGIVAALAIVLVASTATMASGAPVLTDKEQLGKSIFFDQTLSVNQNQSCATCHAPEAGWTGAHSAVNAGGVVYEGSVPGAFGNRKPPSSAYASFAGVLYLDRHELFEGGAFWDGRAAGERLGSPVAEQAQGPFLNPAEQALPNHACVVWRVANGAYPVSFADVWGWDPATAISWPANMDDVCSGSAPLILDAADYALVNMAYDEIGYSVAAYEASPESNAFSSKFDAWRAGTATLTKDEQKGWALFTGKGKCGKCHIARSTGGTPALFTDFTYDNLGIPSNPDLAWFYSPFNSEGDDWVDPGLGGFLASRPDYAPFADANWGKHKVPTLRNVDLRPADGFVKAYGHNGYFKSLEEIVHFYNTRDVPGAGWMGEPWPAPEVTQNVNTGELGDLGLTTDEEAAIVAFMKTLSDGWTP